jgi:multimeric flavodoxin WrbA
VKVLMIIGSPRRGNTYRVAQAVEREIKSLGKDVEFDYLFLGDSGLEFCRGCGLCFTRGEIYCPIRDGRAEIEKQLTEADGVIFASPVYVRNITGLMKNFFDRFAYLCHRPRFFGKYALLISTGGAMGLEEALQAMRRPVATWGFAVVEKAGVLSGTLLPANQDHWQTNRAIEIAASRFYNAIKKKRYYPPTLASLAGFKLQKMRFALANPDTCDYLYFKEMGWLEKESRYYYPVRIGTLRNFAAKLMVSFVSVVT